jgi:heat shock protein HslJ
MNTRTPFPKSLWFALGIIVLVSGFYAFNSYIYEEKQAVATEDYREAQYVIDGLPVRIGTSTDGVISYFGNELFSDLDGDGREDVTFLITSNPGGSGTFYYVVSALNTERGYVGSSAFLLGDRIAPQTTEKGKGNIIVVNYADRAQGEPFTTKPSVGKSVWLILDTQSMQFGTVEQNFEGEADPARMSLGMKEWTWVSTLYNDEREIVPTGSKPFTVVFEKDGMFSASTDCNAVGGSYATDGDRISFSQIFSTKMYCEGSQESDFVTMLSNASGYHFTSKGELVLDLKFDSGSVIFK